MATELTPSNFAAVNAYGLDDVMRKAIHVRDLSNINNIGVSNYTEFGTQQMIPSVEYLKTMAALAPMVYVHCKLQTGQDIHVKRIDVPDGMKRKYDQCMYYGASQGTSVTPPKLLTGSFKNLGFFGNLLNGIKNTLGTIGNIANVGGNIAKIIGGITGQPEISETGTTVANIGSLLKGFKMAVGNQRLNVTAYKYAQSVLPFSSKVGTTLMGNMIHPKYMAEVETMMGNDGDIDSAYRGRVPSQSELPPWQPVTNSQIVSVYPAIPDAPTVFSNDVVSTCGPEEVTNSRTIKNNFDGLQISDIMFKTINSLYYDKVYTKQNSSNSKRPVIPIFYYPGKERMPDNATLYTWIKQFITLPDSEAESWCYKLNANYGTESNSYEGDPLFDVVKQLFVLTGEVTTLFLQYVSSLTIDSWFIALAAKILDADPNVTTPADLDHVKDFCSGMIRAMYALGYWDSTDAPPPDDLWFLQYSMATRACFHFCILLPFAEQMAYAPEEALDKYIAITEANGVREFESVNEVVKEQYFGSSSFPPPNYPPEDIPAPQPSSGGSVTMTLEDIPLPVIVNLSASPGTQLRIRNRKERLKKDMKYVEILAKKRFEENKYLQALIKFNNKKDKNKNEEFVWDGEKMKPEEDINNYPIQRSFDHWDKFKRATKGRKFVNKL